MLRGSRAASSRKYGGCFDGDLSGFRMHLGSVTVPLLHSLLIQRKQIPHLSRFPLLDFVPALLGADPIYLANTCAASTEQLTDTSAH